MSNSIKKKNQTIRIKDPTQSRLKNTVNKFKYIQTGISQPKPQTSLSQFRDSSIKNNSRMQTENTSMVSKAKNSLQSTISKSINKTINSRKKLSQDFTPLPSTPRHIDIYEPKKLRESRLRSVKVQRRKQFTEKLDEKNKKLFKIIYIQRYWRLYVYTKLDNAALLIQKVYFGYLFRKCFIYVKTFNMQLNILINILNKSIVKDAFQKITNQIQLYGISPSISKQIDNRMLIEMNDDQDFSLRDKNMILLKPSKYDPTTKKNKLTKKYQDYNKDNNITPHTHSHLIQNSSMKTKAHLKHNNNARYNHNSLNYIILIQTLYRRHLASKSKSKTKVKSSQKQAELFKVKLFTYYMNNQLYQGILKYVFNQIKKSKNQKKIVIKPLKLDISRNMNDIQNLTSNISVNNELESADYNRLKNLNEHHRNLNLPIDLGDDETITENSFDDEWDENITLRKNVPYSFIPFSYH